MMNRKNSLLIAGFIAFTFIGSQVCVADDEWTDYDPCGWNIEQEDTNSDVAIIDTDDSSNSI